MICVAERGNDAVSHMSASSHMQKAQRIGKPNNDQLKQDLSESSRRRSTRQCPDTDRLGFTFA